MCQGVTANQQAYDGAFYCCIRRTRVAANRRISGRLYKTRATFLLRYLNGICIFMATELQ